MYCQRMKQQDEYARLLKERKQESCREERQETSSEEASSHKMEKAKLWIDKEVSRFDAKKGRRRMKETKAAAGQRQIRSEKKRKRMQGGRRRNSKEDTRKEYKDLETTLKTKNTNAEKLDNITFDDANDAADDEADEAEFGEPEDFEDARSVITELANALDAEEGPPENADDVTQLIRVLWFGAEFDEGCCDAYDRGQRRLANIMSHVRWARWKFAGVTSATQILRPTQVEQVHNEYRDSNMWMPDDVWKKWKRLRDSKKKGSNQDAHQHRRKTFNVFLFKLSGSKALFFHFIKVGTERININALLTAWRTFKTSEEYNKMLARSSEKSAEEKQAKTKRDRIHAELKIMQKRDAKRHRPENVKSMQKLEQQLQEAKREYEKTRRAGRHSSVASCLRDT